MKITNDIQLTEFIRGLKEDIDEQMKLDQNERLNLEEIRKEDLSKLAGKLTQLVYLKPGYDMRKYSRVSLVSKLRETD